MAFVTLLAAHFPGIAATTLITTAAESTGGFVATATTTITVFTFLAISTAFTAIIRRGLRCRAGGFTGFFSNLQGSLFGGGLFTQTLQFLFTILTLQSILILTGANCA